MKAVCSGYVAFSWWNARLRWDGTWRCFTPLRRRSYGLLAQDFGRVLIIVSLHEDHLNVWTTQPCSRLHGGLENAGHQLTVHLQLTNPHV
jgi:hypothetical protein